MSKSVSKMTYTVSGGMLNLTHTVTNSAHICCVAGTKLSSVIRGYSHCRYHSAFFREELQA